VGAQAEVGVGVAEAPPSLLGPWIDLDSHAAPRRALPAEGVYLACLGLSLACLAAGRGAEALALLGHAVATSGRAPGGDAHLALAWRGYAHIAHEQLERAYADLNRAVAMRPDHVLARGWRGSVSLLTGRFDQALEDLEWASARLPSWHRLRARALSDLGLALAQTGRAEQALSRYGEACEAASNDPVVAALTTVRTGAALAMLGRVPDAARYVAQGWAEARALSLWSVEGEALLEAGRLAEARGDVAEALACFEQVRSAAPAVGPRGSVAWASLRAGARYAESGDLERANARLSEAEHLFESLGSRYGLARVLEARALLYLHNHDPQGALAALNDAAATLDFLGSPEAAAIRELIERLGLRP
jgi:tetratricopeptide (TPR) repeat protein